MRSPLTEAAWTIALASPPPTHKQLQDKRAEPKHRFCDARGETGKGRYAPVPRCTFGVFFGGVLSAEGNQLGER